MSSFISAICAELFFALASIFYKLGHKLEMSSLTLVCGRLFTASAILACLMMLPALGNSTRLPFALTQFQVRPPRWHDVPSLALLGLYFPASTLLLCIAIESTSLATSNLLHNLTPVFIALFCLLILRKPSNHFVILGLCITFGGLVCLEFQDIQTNIAAFLGGGSLIAILSALANAGHVLVAGDLKKKGYSSFSVLFWMSFLGTLYLLPLMLVLGVDIFPVTSLGWLLIFGLGLLVQVIAQLLMLKSLTVLSPEVASSFFLLEPVMATGLGYFLFAEKLTGLMLFGFLTILSGLLLICSKMEPEETAPQPLELSPQLVNYSPSRSN